jgi:hypothetical protein
MNFRDNPEASPSREHFGPAARSSGHALSPGRHFDAEVCFMKAILLSVAVFLMVANPAIAQTQGSSTSLERAASPGGAVRLHLSAGGYTVRPSKDNRIHARWFTRYDEDLASVRVKIDVNDKEAVIRASGPHNNFRVEIEIPARSRLYARLTAGELRIEGIEGSKDVESHAGEIDIDVGNPAWYRSVDASVYFGDLDAEAFRVSKGGIARSFTWQGGGDYRLHAHVGAGELRLYSRGAV